MRAKISIFFIALSAIVFFSCEKNGGQITTIPNVRVNFSVNILNTPELQTPLQPKYVGYANGKKVGYKGHGIYLIKINSNEFRAFDASCTFQNNTQAHYEIQEHLVQKAQNPMLVSCPKCKSTFNLLDGNIQTGIARQALKEYKVAVSANTLRIYN